MFCYLLLVICYLSARAYISWYDSNADFAQGGNSAIKVTQGWAFSRGSGSSSSLGLRKTCMALMSSTTRADHLDCLPGDELHSRARSVLGARLMRRETYRERMYLCLWTKTLLGRRRPLGRWPLRAPDQGLESTFCCRVAGQGLAQKECLFHRHRYDANADFLHMGGTLLCTNPATLRVKLLGSSQSSPNTSHRSLPPLQPRMQKSVSFVSVTYSWTYNQR